MRSGSGNRYCLADRSEVSGLRRFQMTVYRLCDHSAVFLGYGIVCAGEAGGTAGHNRTLSIAVQSYTLGAVSCLGNNGAGAAYRYLSAAFNG